MVALKVSGCGTRYAAARDDDRPAVMRLLAAVADPNALVPVQKACRLRRGPSAILPPSFSLYG